MSPGISFIFSDDPTQRKNVGLIDLGTHVAFRLGAGAGFGELIDDLKRHGFRGEAARSLVSQLLATLSRQRLVVATPPATGSRGVHVQIIVFAGFAACITYHHPALIERVAAAFEPMQADPRPVQVRYDLFQCADLVLIRSGSDKDAQIVPCEQAAGALKGYLIDGILANAAGKDASPAACVVEGGRA